MKDSKFLKRLKTELPRWVSLGWVKPEHEQNILNDILNNQGVSGRNSILFFALMGISLLMVGIILFFASNWQAMSKLMKLIILFLSMWGAYGLAAYILITKPKASYFRWMGDLLLLLGTFLFGVNIFLISQIYHIDAHFPNGLLLWSLGTLLVAVLMRNKFCIILSLVLALMWTLTESAYFLFAINWLFILVFIINLLPILKNKWRFSLHASMIVLILWLTTNLFWINSFIVDSETSYYLFYINMLLLSSVLLLVLSIILQHKIHQSRFKIIEHYSLFYLLFISFFMTFPDILNFLKPRNTPLVSLTVLLGIMTTVPMIWMGYNLKMNSRTKEGAAIVFASLIALLIINHFDINPSLMALLFNIYFLGLLTFVVYFGHEIRDAIYINLAFVFFALFVIARYFDVFWRLLERSLFFIIGGLLLIFGSYILEKKRRIITYKLIHTDKHKKNQIHNSNNNEGK